MFEERRKRIRKAEEEGPDLRMLMGVIMYKYDVIKRMDSDHPDIQGLLMVLDELIKKFRRKTLIDMDDLTNQELLND